VSHGKALEPIGSLRMNQRFSETAKVESGSRGRDHDGHEDARYEWPNFDPMSEAGEYEH
jgi:hypothetical protein